jgi:hypothetical protein
MGKSKSKDNIVLLATEKVKHTALLFFSMVFLQFHTPFVAIHKLPDSITAEGFGPFLAIYLLI